MSEGTFIYSMCGDMLTYTPRTQQSHSVDFIIAKKTQMHFYPLKLFQSIQTSRACLYSTLVNLHWGVALFLTLSLFRLACCCSEAICTGGGGGDRCRADWIQAHRADYSDKMGQSVMKEHFKHNSWSFNKEALMRNTVTVCWELFCCTKKGFKQWELLRDNMSS